MTFRNIGYYHICRWAVIRTFSGDDENAEGEEPSQNTKAARRAAILRDVNPSSTLEPNFESLNVKKFDLAFAVDPLFQRTSAQFDEGGARGNFSTSFAQLKQNAKIFWLKIASS